MNIKLQPFRTPNFVLPLPTPGLRQEGWKDLPSIPLRNVDAQELSDMCDAFRAEIFIKADKADPRNP